MNSRARQGCPPNSSLTSKGQSPRLNAVIEQTSTRAATRLALFRWAVFNVLIGNGDAHLKNLSFFVDARGCRLAPFYDLVSTAIYHTPNYRDVGASNWPNCELTMPLGEAKLFSDVSRDSLIAFGQALGLSGHNVSRQLENFLRPVKAKVEGVFNTIVETVNPDGGELRLLNTIRHLPLREMLARLQR